ncbi:MAG TPA: helix-turn-helix domain-containing protein [Longimicrobium sp.]|nr:helix-turn-helix domain-containing protein [Longimicrobium sp.]
MGFRIPGIRPDTVSAEQVRAVRESRGWTAEQLADAVHASPLEVSAWEAGAVRVPPEQAGRIRWMMDSDAWSAEVARVRGEPCEWVRENAPDLYDIMFADLAGNWFAYSAMVREHVAGCATCRATYMHAERIGGAPPEPGNAPDTWRTRYHRWTKRFPRWIGRPLELLGALPGLAVVALAVGTMPDKDAGLAAHIYGGAMGAMIGWGALLLASHGLVRVARRWPRAAGVLAGIAGSAAGLLSWSFCDSGVDLGDPRVWAGAAAVGVALGLVRAARARDEADSPAPALSMGAEPPLLTSPDARPGTRVDDRGPQPIRDVMEAGRYEH